MNLGKLYDRYGVLSITICNGTGRVVLVVSKLDYNGKKYLCDIVWRICRVVEERPIREWVDVAYLCCERKVGYNLERVVYRMFYDMEDYIMKSFIGPPRRVCILVGGGRWGYAYNDDGRYVTGVFKEWDLV